MGGRKWSVEEDAICCKVCVEEYVINKKQKNFGLQKFMMNLKINKKGK